MSKSKDEVTRINPIARVILQGLYDTESPLRKLLGMHYILKAIWNNVVDHWKSRITEPPITGGLGPYFGPNILGVNFIEVRDRGLNQNDLVVQFPEPNDIDINMMPFVMGRKFKETKLPKYLRGYWDQIVKHCIEDRELGKIGYLTIQESYVKEGSSQRRPGIHTESPGVAMLKDGEGRLIYRVFPWGGGRGFHGTVVQLEGGIYMASNVKNSCKVWDCQILRPEVNSRDIVGEHGDIEHLRSYLPSESEIMKANYVYWITDRTPHESLPLSKGTYRQFFRLVTSEVAAWFEDHSTKNPLGVVPDRKITKIVKGSKFDGTALVVDP